MILGSLFTSKAEDSEDDEDTEYFDAMEDAASFITVTTEPSEDGWAPGAHSRAGLPLTRLCSLHSGFSSQSWSRREASHSPPRSFCFISRKSQLFQKQSV